MCSEVFDNEKIAILHSPETILNKRESEELLKAIDILKDLDLSKIDLSNIKLPEFNLKKMKANQEKFIEKIENKYD